jgi:hypothetical protein
MFIVVGAEKTWLDEVKVFSYLDQLRSDWSDVTGVLTGNYYGLEYLSHKWARSRGLVSERISPNWVLQGRDAGYRMWDALLNAPKGIAGVIVNPSTPGLRYLRDEAMKKRLRIRTPTKLN